MFFTTVSKHVNEFENVTLKLKLVVLYCKDVKYLYWSFGRNLFFCIIKL